VDHDEALQEGTMICFEKIHRFDPQIGKAFPFFTQIIINHYKQLCRTNITYRNLKAKYQNHLLDNSDDPHIQSLRSKGKLGHLDQLHDDYKNN
jgi:DNA-directed RNA polymerase specialized sigma24 family protein